MGQLVNASGANGVGEKVVPLAALLTFSRLNECLQRLASLFHGHAISWHQIVAYGAGQVEWILPIEKFVAINRALRRSFSVPDNSIDSRVSSARCNDSYYRFDFPSMNPSRGVEFGPATHIGGGAIFSNQGEIHGFFEMRSKMIDKIDCLPAN